MRLYELIEEVQPLISTTGNVVMGEINRIAEFAQKNCQQWINEVVKREMIFYRGVQHSKGVAAFIKDVRTDRQPKDSISLAHDAYNAMIQSAGGTANRDNSLFCTSSIADARGYGNEFVVMPVGDYSYTWSRQWYDWNITEYSDLIHFVGPLVTDESVLGLSEEELDQAYETELKSIEVEMARTDIPGRREALAKIYEYLSSDAGRGNFEIEYQEEHQEESLYGLTHHTAYNRTLVQRAIAVDEDLEDCHRRSHELMVACERALYIRPDVYEDVKLLLT
jgi:hypothetical protein